MYCGSAVDRAPEIFDGLEIVFGGAPALARPAQQVELERFHFLRLAPRPELRGLRRQRQVQRLGHGARHGVLDLEDVADGQIEGPRPDVQSVVRLDELHGDAQLVAGTPQAAFEHMGGAERIGDLAHVLVLALEGECRGARHHAQRGDVRQPVRQLFGQPVAQRLLALVHAHVDQRQHDDGGQGLRDLPSTWKSSPGIFQTTTASTSGDQDAAEPQRQALERRAPVRRPAADDRRRFQRRWERIGRAGSECTMQSGCRPRSGR